MATTEGVAAADAAGAATDRLADRLDRLRQRNPTNYGYLRQHHEAACRGIERSDRSYPNAAQVHGELPDPDCSPRALGAALKALESLGVIGIWSDSVGSNRYDITEYDPELATRLAEHLAED